MQILTQAQAHKRYPKRGYNKYDPMLLLVGKAAEFKRGVLKMTLTVHGQTISKIPLKLDPECMDEPEGTSMDVTGKICRMVIWK